MCDFIFLLYFSTVRNWNIKNCHRTMLCSAQAFALHLRHPFQNRMLTHSVTHWTNGLPTEFSCVLGSTSLFEKVLFQHYFSIHALNLLNMTATKAKNRSYIHEIYGLKETIVMILSDSLVQIWVSRGKKEQRQRKWVKDNSSQWLTSLFPFCTKTGDKSKKAADSHLRKAVIKLVMKYAFFLWMRRG